MSDDERVVNGQHLMQATSDIFLGWCSPIGFDGVQRDYSLRQLRDRKGSAVVETMDPSRLEMYARLCGRALARAHARSGDRIAISAHLGTSNSFDDAIADFSESYADRNEADYQVLLEAESSDRTPREDQHRSGGIRMPQSPVIRTCDRGVADDLGDHPRGKRDAGDDVGGNATATWRGIACTTGTRCADSVVGVR